MSVVVDNGIIKLVIMYAIKKTINDNTIRLRTIQQILCCCFPKRNGHVMDTLSNGDAFPSNNEH